MSEMKEAMTERLRHWKSLLAVPKLVKLVGSLYAALGAATWIRDELVKRNPSDSVKHIIDYIPQLTGWQWGLGAAVILLLAVLETSFQRKQEATAFHATEVKGFEERIAGLKRTIEAQEERLKEGPTVVLSNVGTGINLRVECLKQDAINVRLVQANAKNYFINSDVVRLLRVGTSETLVLHCHPQQAGGSLVLQGFSSPTLFFNDTLPPLEGESLREQMESAMTLLTERQMALIVELAYSNLQGTHHYRSSFRVRWSALQESIVDVEPISTSIDPSPPSSAPPDVIPVQIGELAFVEWHAGDARGFPNQYGDAHPSWIAVVNKQTTPARRATNVTARLEFMDSSGTTQFTVPQTDWFYVERMGTTKVESWRRDVTIEGGDEQSFVLFSQGSNRTIVSKSSGEPIGWLDYDKWRVKIIVTSDDAQGFEGHLGFTITRSGMEIDRPAFKLQRTIPPLVGSRVAAIKNAVPRGET
jgi:hypothetical protein